MSYKKIDFIPSSLLLKNGDISTIYPSLFRRPLPLSFSKEKIYLPDGDFLNLQWIKRDHKNLVILCHGLEGHAETSYIVGMINKLSSLCLDFLSWNYRSCGGEMNLTAKFYHMADTEDLSHVINYALSLNFYDKIILIGFSMGGNIICKYLSEREKLFPPQIKLALTFSVACDLTSTSLFLDTPRNKIYRHHLLTPLNKKVILKKDLLAKAGIPLRNIKRSTTFRHFDDHFTAPLHGFQSAEDYWMKASTRPLLEKIHCPTYMVNAQDDPFLQPASFPIEESKNHPFFHFRLLKYGGHVGFLTRLKKGEYFSEYFSFQKINSLLSQ